MILKQDPSTSAMILQSFSSNLHRSSVLDTKILTHILSSPKNPTLSTELQLSFYRPLKQGCSRRSSLRATSRRSCANFPEGFCLPRIKPSRTRTLLRLCEFSREIFAYPGIKPSRTRACPSPARISTHDT
ncbi:hypothetical protein QL285_060293 [Trifolium repens]|nr:hypothetical protein QL285_060293 [Trifolium repens]